MTCSSHLDDLESMERVEGEEPREYMLELLRRDFPEWALFRASYDSNIPRRFNVARRRATKVDAQREALSGGHT